MEAAYTQDARGFKILARQLQHIYTGWRCSMPLVRHLLSLLSWSGALFVSLMSLILISTHVTSM